MNILGIFSIKYFDTKSYNLPYLAANSNINLIPIVGVNFKSIDFILGKATMKTKSKNGAAGEITTITIEFIVAGHDKEVITELNRIKITSQNFVIQDNMKQKYLLGTKNGARAKFSFQLKNDADGSGGRSIKCKIELKTPVFPIYVTD